MESIQVLPPAVINSSPITIFFEASTYSNANDKEEKKNA